MQKYNYGWSSAELIRGSSEYVRASSLAYADNGTYVTFFTDEYKRVWYKRSYWSTGPFLISNLTAQDVQAINWDDMGNMKAMSFNHINTPYEFKITPPAMPQKTTGQSVSSQQILAVLKSKDVYFGYGFGNILLNSEPVNFVKLDTDKKKSEKKNTEEDLMTEGLVIDRNSECVP